MQQGTPLRSVQELRNPLSTETLVAGNGGDWTSHIAVAETDSSDVTAPVVHGRLEPTGWCISQYPCELEQGGSRRRRGIASCTRPSAAIKHDDPGFSGPEVQPISFNQGNNVISQKSAKSGSPLLNGLRRRSGSLILTLLPIAAALQDAQAQTSSQSVPSASQDAGGDSSAQPKKPSSQAQIASATVADAASASQQVVVTAKSDSNAVQKSSQSVDVVGGVDLEKRAVPDLATLIQSIAGVSLKTEGVGQTEIEMRGMTSSGGNSPTTGFYLDGIPLTPPSGAQNGKVVISPALYDMESVEVLRGPQGTQFGAGAMGGAVKLTTVSPDPSGLNASIQAILSGTRGGGLNHTENFMLNAPLVQDTLALRIVGTEAYTSGWIDRIVANPFPVVTNGGATRGNVQDAPVQASYKNSNADQQYNLRMSLLWKVTPQWTITPGIYDFTSYQAGISAYDSTPGTETHYQPFDIAEPMTDRMRIEALTTAYAFDSSRLTWNVSYWKRRSTQIQDGSEDFNNPLSGATLASNTNSTGPQPGYYGPGGTGTVVGTEDDPSSQLSSEIRLASNGNGPLQWVLGAFASNNFSTWNFSGITANPSVYMDLGTNQAATTDQWFVAYSPNHMKQYALFGDGTYALDDHWKVEAGARLYRYENTFSSTISGWGSGLGAATPSTSGLITTRKDGINPKLDVSYEFSEDNLAYVTAARGARPGGGNASYPTTGPFWGPAYAPFDYTNGWPKSYKPDDVWSYEIGEKARFLDHRLTVSASAYYEDWRNPQLLAYPGDWAFNVNGDKARIEGADVDMKAKLGGGFTVGADLGYTHGSVSPGAHWEISPSNVMPDVPKFNGNLNLSYRRLLADGRALTAEVDNAYVGARYSLSFVYPYQSTGTYVSLPGYNLTNLRLGLESPSGWSASLFVDNLFNKHVALENMFQETEPSAAFTRTMTNQPATMGINLTYRM